MQNIVGNNIRQRRLELKLSQAQLAKLMGYKSKAAISRVENGHEDLTLDRVVKYANALRCPPAYLAGWEKWKQKESSTEQSLLYNAYERADIKSRNIVCNALEIDYIDIEKKSSELA